MADKREGEKALPFDPAGMAGDARIVFLGKVASPWTQSGECPKNMAAARETGRPATVDLDPQWREGLHRIERYSHVIVLTWLDRSQRDLILQKPRHARSPQGTFSLRSPVRPNPVGVHVARLLRVDHDAGRLYLEAIDVFDGTPVIDIKPYHPFADAVADATVAPE